MSGCEEVAAFAVQVARDFPALQPIFDDWLTFMEGEISPYSFFGGGVTSWFDELLDSDPAEAQRFLDYLEDAYASDTHEIRDPREDDSIRNFIGVAFIESLDRPQLARQMLGPLLLESWGAIWSEEPATKAPRLRLLNRFRRDR